jgi:hypothetical protein
VSLHCDDESLTELSERVQRLLNKVWLLNLDRKDLPIPQRGSRIPLAKTRFASGIRREDWWLAADRCVYDETGNLVFDTKFRTTEGPFGERRLLLELLSRLGNIRGEIFIGKLSLDAREITLGTRAFAKVLRGRFTSRS